MCTGFYSKLYKDSALDAENAFFNSASNSEHYIDKEINPEINSKNSEAYAINSTTGELESKGCTFNAAVCARDLGGNAKDSINNTKYSTAIAKHSAINAKNTKTARYNT